MVPGLFKGPHSGSAESSTTADEPAKLKLLAGDVPTVEIPPDVIKKLGLKTAEVQQYTAPQELKLDGTLFVDPSHLARVHARFPGEVVELGRADPGNPQSPPIRFGDRVRKDQLLAVVWCKDLGEKKSELIDALLRWRLDVDVLRRLDELAQKGATPEQKVRDAEHTRDADWIAVTRARRTLSSWRLTEPEIQRIEQEADAIGAGKTGTSSRAERDWSRVEVVAPMDGVVVEVNSNVGDIIDTSLDVMKIADLSRLRVLCQVYEEDLAHLEELKPEERLWTVHLGADPDAKPLNGTGGFDQIGRIIDPNQHTAQVMGWVDNPDERLLIGQFVTAMVKLPPAGNLVAVPSTAVIENGAGSKVFVRHGSGPDWRLEPRVIALVGQGHDVARIVCHPNEQQLRDGAKPLEPYEEVLANGVLELADAMEDLESANMESTGAKSEKPGSENAAKK